MNTATASPKTAKSPASREIDRTRRLDALHEVNARLALYEFWGEDPAYERQATDHLQMRVAAQPHHWKYKDIHPCLLEAAELIPLEISERRSLIMMNPALKPLVATVTTMFAAYRINVPNEIAPAHRHSPNAIRFGLTGNTNFTSVNGENVTFGPGDLVLTPNDTWHNHGNGPDVASVNLSVLDMPLVNVLNATFFDTEYKEEVEPGKAEHKRVQSATVSDDYSSRVYGSSGLTPRHISHVRGPGTSSPKLVYRWDDSANLLHRLREDEGSPYEGLMIEYTDPVLGGPVYKTMTFMLQMLRPGQKLLPMRQNASQICTVFRGSGTSKVGKASFDWEEFDTFCIPGGEWCQHTNTSETEDAIFLVSSDEPTLRALGLNLKHGKDARGNLVTLETFHQGGF